MISCVCSLRVNAQTDFEIKSDKPDLEQEYRAELDRWMLTAYEGDPEAQFKVGVLYTNTQFDKADYEQAVYWYKQAARQGHVLAQYNLGHQYLLGVGVNKNEASAMNWWLEAAKQDHPLAQFNVGRAFYLGIGLDQDHKKSKYWFKRAAENKEPKSIEILQQLGWEDGEIDDSINRDYNIKSKPESVAPKLAEAEVAKEPSDLENLPTSNKKPNLASQLKIKEARDRRASTNLTSKIVPIDLTEEAEVAANKNTTNDTAEPTEETVADTKSPKPEASPAPEIESAPIVAKTKVENSPEQENSLEPIKSPEALATPNTTNTSKIIISRNNDQPGDLRPDEKQPSSSSLNKVIAGPVSGNPPSIEQAPALQASNQAEPIPVNNIGPIAIYTDPQVRSVLIAIVDDRTELEISKAGPEWSSVKSSKGIPVWIHGDYLKLDQAIADNKTTLGSVTGDNVNTRSVPIVSSGTVIGRVNKGERLKVMEQRGVWYRVIGPARFVAWVKTDDFNTPLPPAETEPSEAVLAPASAELDLNRSDEKWLFQQKASDFTLQLASFTDATQIEKYLQQVDLTQSPELHPLISTTDELQRTVFLYGKYKDRESAKQAKSQINQNQAWVRTFGGLQKYRCEIWRAQEPSPSELAQYCK